MADIASFCRVDAQRSRPGGCCEVCGIWNPEPVCATCVERFAAPRWRCPRCALPIPAGSSGCADCLRTPPRNRHAWCAVDYGFPWDRLVTRLKFHDSPELASPIATLMVRRARQSAWTRPDAFVAVPLSSERLARRGYDQAWEIARRVARALGAEAFDQALERRFDGQTQTRLDRAARLRNLRGAFVAQASARTRLRGATLALVDDVMTTGATADEATAALLDAGASAVDLWVFARTPEPGGNPA